MTFLILIVLALLMILVFSKYKNIYSVIIAIMLLFGITTAFLLWGMTIMEEERIIQFFSRTISSGELYRLMAFWYAVDAVCAALIIRSYIAYRKINPRRNRNMPDKSNK